MADFVFADNYSLGAGHARDYLRIFLRGLVHKQNNYLGVIQGFSSLMLTEEGITPGIRENALQMHESAKIASRMNEALLGAAGNPGVSVEKMNFADVRSFLVRKAEEVGAQHGVSVATTIGEALPDLRGDAGALRDVLVPLLVNAVEGAAETESRAASLDVFAPGKASESGHIDLFVRNSAADLSEPELEKCFEPFHSTKSGEHFGLGLTAAAILAGDMGMRLGLRSESGTMTAWLAIPPA